MSIAIEDSGSLKVSYDRRLRNDWRGMSFVLLFMPFVIAMWILAPHPAQAESGFYLSSELGANFASDLDMTGTSNDRASVCDEFINPMFATVTQTAGYEDSNCTSPDRGQGDGWKNGFDSAEGILAGAALGYKLSDRFPDRVWGRFRLELEYFYRDTGYDQTSAIPGVGGAGVHLDKLTQEILTATDRIGSITSHNLFGNLYFDFPNSSRYTPYMGLGAGVSFTDIEYGSVWARNPDSNAIATGAGLPNVDEIRQNLAGSTSSALTKLSDTLFGYQLLFGIDYALTETSALGIKGRWVKLDSFSDSGVVWDPLRSHQPNLRKDLSEPVSGSIETGDIEMFGISVTLKYRF